MGKNKESIFRASTGAALDKIENPELVLQQTIRDMRDRVPELNNSVAQVMATERLLLKNKENLSKSRSLSLIPRSKHR